jgi:L-lactate dehydrogenase complex protein LldG
MNEREKILGRIREALQNMAPYPGQHHGKEAHLPEEPPVTDAREWLPAVGAGLDEPLALFAKNATELKADFRLLPSIKAMRETLVELRSAEKWERVACHSGGLTDAVLPMLGLPLLRTDRPYDAQTLEKCDVGISECDALVAQTGSVLVTSRSCGGRALSILPPHHVVLAHREQLLPDLPAAFEMLSTRYAPNYPSMISFITGPSRTGDIERILVLGAHGPKKLTILCF